MAESEEKLKSLLMTVKGESEKAGLKLNTQKAKIMWSRHSMANRWGKSRNGDRFYCHELKISVDVDWQPLN